jgi:hypothetical protein
MSLQPTPVLAPILALVASVGMQRSTTAKQSPRMLWQQLGPGAAQSFLNPDHGGHQDIDPACFDFLNRADVQVHQFSEALLRHRLSSSLTADVRSQLLQLPFDGQVTWHALLGRKSFLSVTAHWGVIDTAVKEISL